MKTQVYLAPRHSFRSPPPPPPPQGVVSHPKAPTSGPLQTGLLGTDVPFSPGALASGAGQQEKSAPLLAKPAPSGCFLPERAPVFGSHSGAIQSSPVCEPQSINAPTLAANVLSALLALGGQFRSASQHKHQAVTSGPNQALRLQAPKSEYPSPLIKSLIPFVSRVD